MERLCPLERCRSCGRWPAAATAESLAAAGYLSTAGSSQVSGRVSVGLFHCTEDPTMTEEMMSQQALSEKSADTDLLHEMIGFARASPDGREPDRHGARRADLITRDTAAMEWHPARSAGPGRQSRRSCGGW